MKRLFQAALILLLLPASMALGQPPTLSHTAPSGVQPGKTVDVVFHGANLAAPTSVWTSFPASAVLTPGIDQNGAQPASVSYRLTIPAEVPLGVGGIRVATGKGISNLRLLLIDDLPAIAAARQGGPPLVVEAFSRDGDRPLGQGKLAVIDNEINQQTATLKLKAVFDNPKHLLWPNQFVKARLRLATRRNALVVPAAVVQHGPTGTFAYVVKADSTVENRPVTLTAIQGDVAVIASGLPPEAES